LKHSFKNIHKKPLYEIDVPRYITTSVKSQSTKLTFDANFCSRSGSTHKRKWTVINAELNKNLLDRSRTVVTVIQAICSREWRMRTVFLASFAIMALHL